MPPDVDILHPDAAVQHQPDLPHGSPVDRTVSPLFINHLPCMKGGEQPFDFRTSASGKEGRPFQLFGQGRKIYLLLF